MFLIVGLGNPGKKYENNRHNIGYLVVDQITEVKSQKSPLRQGYEWQAKVKSHLLKPDKFMNSSGFQVRKQADYYKIDSENIIVIHDDVDLDFGKVKISFSSGSAGHNGVKSIIKHLETQDFWRVRVGIDRPRQGQETDNYVLEDFSPEQKEKLAKIIDQTANFVLESLSKLKEETLNIV